jgi:enterobactin synthetase component D
MNESTVLHPGPLVPDLVDDVATVLAAMLGSPAIVVEASRPVASTDALTPAERRCVSSAVAGRQAEFAGGRLCARRALARLGFTYGSLLSGADRAPQWPAGFVGSITHTEGICAVVVASTSVLRGVGIDAERIGPLPTDLEPLICTEAERSWLSKRPRDCRGDLAKVIFSAKEAFYKCQYPLSRRFLEFRDVEVALALSVGTFSIHPVAPMSDLPFDVRAARGRWARTNDFVLTTVQL